MRRTRIAAIYMVIAVSSLMFGIVVKADGLSFNKLNSNSSIIVSGLNGVKPEHSHELIFKEIREEAQSYLKRKEGLSDQDYLAELRKGLKSKNSRLSSIIAIGALGEKGAPAVEDLIDFLGDRKGNIVNHTIWALGEIGTASYPAATEIAKGLDGKKEKRFYLLRIHALGQIGNPALGYADDVFETFLYSEQKFEKDTYEALTRMGVDWPGLIAEYLDHFDPKVRSHAAYFAAEFNIHDKILVAPTTRILKDDFGPGIHNAAALLGQMGPLAREAMPALLQVPLKHPAAARFRDLTPDQLTFVNGSAFDVGVNRFSLTAMSSYFRLAHENGKFLTEVVRPDQADLLKIVETNAGQVQELALHALKNYPEHRKLVNEKFVEVLEKTQMPTERRNYLRSLANTGDPERQMDAMAYKMLRSDNRHDREASLYYYYKIGVSDYEIAPELRKIMGSETRSQERLNAAGCLAKFPGKLAVTLPFLLEEVEKTDGKYRDVILNSIREIGKSDSVSIPFLKAGLESEEPLARAVSALALGDLGKAAVDTLPLLRNKLEMETAGIHKYYREAILKLEMID